MQTYTLVCRMQSCALMRFVTTMPYFLIYRTNNTIPHQYLVTDHYETILIICRRHSSVSFTGPTTRATQSTRSRSSDSASHCSLAATGKILCDLWRSCAPRATGLVAQAPNVETSVKVSDLHPYQFFSTLLRASLFPQQNGSRGNYAPEVEL